MASSKFSSLSAASKLCCVTIPVAVAVAVTGRDTVAIVTLNDYMYMYTSRMHRLN